MMNKLSVGPETTFRIVAAFFAIGSLLPLGAQDVNFEALDTFGWIHFTDGSLIKDAPAQGNTGSNISFEYWDGQLVTVGADYPGPTNSTSTATIGINLTLPSEPAVNALLNTLFGQPNEVNAVVVFTNSDGATATYSLVGGQTIRDYTSSGGPTSLQGFNTDYSLGDVITQNWWNDSSAGGTDNLDVSTFFLPSSWAGTTLESLTLENPLSKETSADDIALSGIQVESIAPPALAVPESSSNGLLVTSLLGLGLGWSFVRRGRVA
jgi:hypothetical protein